MLLVPISTKTILNPGRVINALSSRRSRVSKLMANCQPSSRVRTAMAVLLGIAVLLGSRPVHAAGDPAHGMAFRGLPNAQDRADVIAYLHQAAK